MKNFLLLLSAFFFYHLVSANNNPLIWPIPQEIKTYDGSFIINESTLILVPQHASFNDMDLARLLVKEFSDKFGLALKIEHTSKLPSNSNYIIIGDIFNPLINHYCSENKISITSENPGKEGYVLTVNKNIIVIAGYDSRGSFYGLQSLRQLIKKDNNNVSIQNILVRDWPYMPFRGIKLYIPGKESIPYFEKFIENFMALYKYNKIILEVNAVMRLDRHPELNAGWTEFAKELIYSRRERPEGPNGEFQNSTHHDAGDGRILEKRDVANIVELANRNFIEVIPEIPSLTHSYYLLTRHKDLAEIQNAEWPDTYCPSNPKSYELIFDVMDEYIEVINPKMVMIGHDEWRMPINVCTKCKGKEYPLLFAQDVNKVYSYLTGKNIKVGMWGDHLLESVRGKGIRKGSDYNRNYDRPGALSEQQVLELIPKEILIFNWFWSGENGESNDLKIQEMGFEQVYGNFRPEINNWKNRSSISSVLGGAPSSWAATTEFNFGKDLMNDYLGCSNLLWSSHWPDKKELISITQNMMKEVRSNLSSASLPSNDNNIVTPIEIGAYFNTSSIKIPYMPVSSIRTGNIVSGNKNFYLADPLMHKKKFAIAVGMKKKGESYLPTEVKGIKINKDASSIIFLHSCAKPEKNEMSYYYIYNFEDAAALLGWYEIVFDDGFVETVPIRYGVNILEWNMINNNYCYFGDALDCSNYNSNEQVMFFAFEWVNSRYGKKIKEINLKSSLDFSFGRNGKKRLLNDNAIILKAISIVEKRK